MILSDNATKLDLLNNKAIANTIVSIITECKDSVSIGVHGDWGAGKSSVLEMVEDLLNSKTEKNVIHVAEDLEWDDWGEQCKPEEVSTISPEPPLAVAIVHFNGWEHQGFEDAKIALMSAIVKELQKMARSFCKKHPVKGAWEKLEKTCKGIWKNIDKLNVAKVAGQVGIPLIAGANPLLLLGVAANYAKEVFTDKSKFKEFMDAAEGFFKHAPSEKASYKEMVEFRSHYEELFKAAHIGKLVVLIDDLDRCLPRVAIETLEAIRMFLSMEKTVFIIAADDAMICYAVKDFFPHADDPEGTANGSTTGLGENIFAEKYLEKIIQVPFHIPRLGISEAQLYIMLLLVEAVTGESEGLKRLAYTAVEKLHKPWALEPLAPEEIREVLEDEYPVVASNVKIAKCIGRILAENTNGNPRQIKRFINMLTLRTKVARTRGFDETEMEMAVLAKMMLAEQYIPDFYKALASELEADGTCPALEELPPTSKKATPGNKSRTKEDSAGQRNESHEDQVEASAPIAGHPKNKKTFANLLEQSSVQAWLKIEPPLRDKDLRPYFFACTEREDFFFESPEESLGKLVAIVRGGEMSVVTCQNTLRDLDVTVTKRLFQAVSQIAFRENLSTVKPPKIIEGIKRLVICRPDLQEDLANFLLTLPCEKLGAWSVNGWDACIPESSNAARDKLKQFLKRLETNGASPLIKKSARKAQE